MGCIESHNMFSISTTALRNNSSPFSDVILLIIRTEKEINNIRLNYSLLMVSISQKISRKLSVVSTKSS